LISNFRLSTYEDETECSETSVYKIQTPGIYPEESIQQNWGCTYTLPYIIVFWCLFCKA